MKKTLTVLMLLVTASTLYVVPSYARPQGEPPKIDGGVVPPECANPDTKTKHPDWYRDEGFCSPELGNIDSSGPPNVH